MTRLLTRKLLNDIRRNPGQFALMAVAVFISVFALTTLINALGMINASTAAAYLGTNPAQATIETDGQRPLPTILAGGIQSERRTSLVGRIDNLDGHWFPLVLFVIEDFTNWRIGAASPDSGDWPPAPGSLLLERSAMELLGRQAGQSARLILPGIEQTSIKLGGTTHDPGLAPAWQERTVYGYISLAGASALFGRALAVDELKLVFPAPQASQSELRFRADQLALELRAQGYAIHEIQVPPPRTHPHQSQMNTIMGIFLAFSLLSLALSGVLLATLVKSLLQAETRLIGIMKTLGGRPGELVRHYLGLAVLPALAGSLMALPLGLWCAQGLAGLMVSLLNLGSARLLVEALSILFPLLAGLAIPAALALLPVILASRQTIRETLAGPLAPPPRISRSRLRLPRLLALAIRNLARRPARLVLNLGLLGVAGALFIAALNIGASYRATLALAGEGRHYDLDLRLDNNLDQAVALSALRTIKGIDQAESWTRQPVYPAGDWHFPLTGQYPDKGHGSFTLSGRPVDARLLDLKVTEGDLAELDRWSAAAQGTEPLPIALNQNALALLPGARLGEPLELLVNGQRQTFRLVALIREIGPAGAWIPLSALSRLPGCDSRLANAWFIKLESGLAGTEEARRIFAAAEEALAGLGGRVEMSLAQEEFASALGGHVWTLIYALGLMALVIGCVGLLGLSAAMGASVLERTREIGVLRAIGGTPGSIRALILGEAGLQAALGFAIAIILAWPLSILLGNLIGSMSFRIPLQTTLDPSGIAIWATIQVLGGLSASLMAARRAASGTVHVALAYE